jgi:hypothetical protein
MKHSALGAVALLVVLGGVGVTARHAYETHLSSDYARILRATLQTSSLQERAAYIHDARVAVRTTKDQETEVKLEKLQTDVEENLTPECQSLQYTADGLLAKSKRTQTEYEQSVADYGRQSPQAEALYKAVMSDSSEKASSAVIACIAAASAAQHAEAARLWPELSATAGIPVR